MTRPKDKGTWAETHVALYLRENGWPYAERRALAGAEDRGDITGCPGLAWEVKYANGGIRMGTWVGEMIAERTNAGADHAVLVVKPSGHGAAKIGSWLAVMVAWDFNALVAKIGPAASYGAILSKVSAYNGATVVRDLHQFGQSLPELAIPVLERRPPGTKDAPQDWYRVMTLEHATILLRQAGYGSPIDQGI